MSVCGVAKALADVQPIEAVSPELSEAIAAVENNLMLRSIRYLVTTVLAATLFGVEEGVAGMQFQTLNGLW